MWYAVVESDEGWKEIAQSRHYAVLRYFYNYADIIGGW